MDKFLRFLFPVKPDETGFSAYLLIMRIVFGLLLMSHGFQKLTSFSDLVSSFPDPLGVGASVSLSLAILDAPSLLQPKADVLILDDKTCAVCRSRDMQCSYHSYNTS